MGKGGGIMDFHKAAEMFPMMSDVEITDLSRNIMVNGLINPILTHEGKILDGRNRYVACQKVGVKPTLEAWSGDNPFEYVWSINAERRHLKEGQKAVIYLLKQRQSEDWVKGQLRRKIETSEKKASFASQRTRKEDGTYRPSTPLSRDNGVDNTDELDVFADIPIHKETPKQHQEIAKAVGIGEATAARAQSLVNSRPDLAQKVAGGSMSLPEAIKQKHKEERIAESGWTESETNKRNLVEAGISVVANQKTEARLIAWAEENGNYVRIDRFSDWGNPFLLPQDGDRETVIEHYKQYLEWRPSLLKRLHELRGKVLGCWCAPELCHGNVLLGKLNVSND
jgi:hypothetical protein